MISVFVSYAREDEEIALEVFNFLRANGYRPWMDKMNLVPGMNWEREIERAVEQSDLQVFVLSPKSVAKRGVFQKEIRLALKKAEELLESDISIIPLRVDDCEIPNPLLKYQWVDYSNVNKDRLLISTLSHATEQRGFLNDKANDQPIVSEIRCIEEVSRDGSVSTSFSVPRILFPNDETLGEMISAQVLGAASDQVLSFKGEVDIEFWREHMTRPYELHISTSVEFLNPHVMSALNAIYKDLGGAHGYGYTTSLNVLVDDKRSFSCSELVRDYSFLVDALLNEAKETNDNPLVPANELSEVAKSSLSNNSYVNQSGVVVRFNQYEVFCYAHGPVDLEFLWDEKELADSNLTELGKRVRAFVGRSI